MPGKFYIVWNEAKSEGFITNSKDDADKVIRYAETGCFRNNMSAAGHDFADTYGNDNLSIQEVEL